MPSSEDDHFDKCGCCQTTEFSSDVSSNAAPVQSSSCSHNICRSCVLNCHLRKLDERITAVWISCPLCNKKKAFRGPDMQANLTFCHYIGGMRKKLKKCQAELEDARMRLDKLQRLEQCLSDVKVLVSKNIDESLDLCVGAPQANPLPVNDTSYRTQEGGSDEIISMGMDYPCNDARSVRERSVEEEATSSTLCAAIEQLDKKKDGAISISEMKTNVHNGLDSSYSSKHEDSLFASECCRDSACVLSLDACNFIRKGGDFYSTKIDRADDVDNCVASRELRGRALSKGNVGKVSIHVAPEGHGDGEVGRTEKVFVKMGVTSSRRTEQMSNQGKEDNVKLKGNEESEDILKDNEASEDILSRSGDKRFNKRDFSQARHSEQSVDYSWGGMMVDHLSLKETGAKAAMGTCSQGKKNYIISSNKRHPSVERNPLSLPEVISCGKEIGSEFGQSEQVLPKLIRNSKRKREETLKPAMKTEETIDEQPCASAPTLSRSSVTDWKKARRHEFVKKHSYEHDLELKQGQRWGAEHQYIDHTVECTSGGMALDFPVKENLADSKNLHLFNNRDDDEPMPPVITSQENLQNDHKKKKEKQKKDKKRIHKDKLKHATKNEERSGEQSTAGPPMLRGPKMTDSKKVKEIETQARSKKHRKKKIKRKHDSDWKQRSKSRKTKKKVVKKKEGTSSRYISSFEKNAVKEE